MTKFHPHTMTIKLSVGAFQNSQTETASSFVLTRPIMEPQARNNQLDHKKRQKMENKNLKIEEMKHLAKSFPLVGE